MRSHTQVTYSEELYIADRPFNSFSSSVKLILKVLCIPLRHKLESFCFRASAIYMFTRSMKYLFLGIWAPVMNTNTSLRYKHGQHIHIMKPKGFLWQLRLLDSSNMYTTDFWSYIKYNSYIHVFNVNQYFKLT